MRQTAISIRWKLSGLAAARLVLLLLVLTPAAHAQPASGHELFAHLGDYSIQNWQLEQGSLWIGLYGITALRWQDGGVVPHQLGEFSDPQQPAWTMTPHALFEDRSGSAWLGCTHGLLRSKDGRFTTFTTRDGMISDRISSLAQAGACAYVLKEDLLHLPGMILATRALPAATSVTPARHDPGPARSGVSLNTQRETRKQSKPT